MLALAIAPAPVIEAQAGVARRAELLKHQDVVFGILEAEKARSLNDPRPRLAALSVREVDGGAQLIPFAIKSYFLTTHS
jgi:hypothetical protein